MTRQRASFLVLLLPVLCLSLGADHPDPARFEKQIVKIEERYKDKSADDVDVVFVGSSSIRMWNLEKSFSKLAAVNCGFGGSILADSTHYTDRLVKRFTPKYIVLYAGDNDVGGGLSVNQVVEDYQECIAAFRKAAPGVKLLYVAIKPSRKRWVLYSQMRDANRRIQHLTEQDDDAKFVDIASAMLGETGGPPPKDLFVKDGLHLSEKGYEMWTRLVKEAMSEL